MSLTLCPHRESNPGLLVKSEQHYRHALEALYYNDFQQSYTICCCLSTLFSCVPDLPRESEL